MTIPAGDASCSERRASIASHGSTDRPGRTAFAALALAGALSLGGCATVLDGHPQPVADPDEELKLLRETIDAKAVVACLGKPSEACRNQVVGARMYAADLRFAQFEEQLFKEGRKTAFGSSVAALGLSAAATASTGGTAQALSGLNTLLLGSREAYQKDLLGERTAAAIHTAMHARRTEVAVRLQAGLRSDIDDYPLSQALRDLTEYVRAGTLVGALTEITSTVGEASKKAERDLADAVVTRFRPPTAAVEALKMTLCGAKTCVGQSRNVEEWTRAKGCFATAGIEPGTTFTQVANGGVDDERIGRLIECMKTRR